MPKAHPLLRVVVDVLAEVAAIGILQSDAQVVLRQEHLLRYRQERCPFKLRTLREALVPGGTIFLAADCRHHCRKEIPKCFTSDVAPERGCQGTRLQLHDVGVQRALPVVQQLTRDDALAGAAAALQELDGHLLLRLGVHRQLHKARGAPARGLGIASGLMAEEPASQQIDGALRLSDMQPCGLEQSPTGARS